MRRTGLRIRIEMQRRTQSQQRTPFVVRRYHPRPGRPWEDSVEGDDDCSHYSFLVWTWRAAIRTSSSFLLYFWLLLFLLRVIQQSPLQLRRLRSTIRIRIQFATAVGWRTMAPNLWGFNGKAVVVRRGEDLCRRPHHPPNPPPNPT